MQPSPSYRAEYRLIFLHTTHQQSPQILYDVIREREALYLKLPPELTDVDQTLAYIIQADEACLAQADVLVIDEADKFSEPLLVDVLHHIMAAYTCDILVMTRCLPFQSLWEDAFDQPPQIITDNTLQPHFKSQLGDVIQAIAFGRGTVTVNGWTVPFSIGDTVHNFFFYLLEHPIVTRDDVLNVFWTNLTPQSAVTNFHVTRQNLNQLLGVEFLQSDRGLYRLNPELTIIYDVEIYRDLLQSITYQLSQTDTITQYQDAYNLYEYDYLMTSTQAWVQPIRDNLRLMQSDVCFRLAQTQLPTIEALGLLSQSFRYNPYREDIIDEMMQLYLREQMPCDALNVYDALSANLKTRHNIRPQKHLTKLARQAEEACYA